MSSSADKTTSKNMLNFTPIPFKPPLWLQNAHLQTIIAKVIAPKIPAYRRELVLDSLQESQIAYDFYDAKGFDITSFNLANLNPVEGKEGKNIVDQDKQFESNIIDTPLVVMYHGMEGSSESHYARTMAHFVHAQGWHFVVVHFRSCGGIPASGEVFYDAGDSQEIHHSLTQLTKRYQTIHCIGTSLGGNMLAKYMGEYGDDAICKSACMVSAPLDLASSSIAMDSFIGSKVYTPYLLKPIAKKALEQPLSDEIVKAIKLSRKISDFDHVFTAPRHGYRSKNDYYRQASAMPYLYKITKPTLIISAKDDPFLGVTPTKEDVSDSVILCEPKHGGHIGFIDFKHKQFDSKWFAKVSMQFYNSVA